nr:alkaline phosphatase PhoX [Pseudomarimonas arenosa]
MSGCSSAPPRVLAGLQADPHGICDLPPGFDYRVISKHGDLMSDAQVVPDYHDGMGCFTGPSGNLVLVRNHEISTYFPFDPPSPIPDLAYDPAASGGTTTIWLNDRLEIEQHYLSLTGTIRNCSGGKTPWGTWISSEEAGQEGWMMGKRHGYNFEVNPFQPLQRAEPLKAMGRFSHEAIAFDRNGAVYQTEDDSNGCFYRFLPTARKQLAKGGRLQALKLIGSTSRHTTQDALQPGQRYACEWVDVDEPDPEQNTVRLQAQAKGAAIFVRGEGVVAHADGVYFVCSAGGAEGLGQIFKYSEEPNVAHGWLELMYTARAGGLLMKPDHITIAPWGDLVLCEDTGQHTNCLVGLTAAGKAYHIAANSQAEWCGATFSPDGRTLFANIHKKPGMTLAIRGPWAKLRV